MEEKILKRLEAISAQLFVLTVGMCLWLSAILICLVNS